MKTITWAAIGCGNVCEVKSLPAMYKLPGSRVAGVFARNSAKAADFAQRHGIAKVYGSVEELLGDPLVDMVYISTPPDTHKAYTMAALNAGKPVYVEKPMGLNYAECLAMHQHAQKLELKLFVAHYRRALPYFLQVKKLLDEAAIGKLINVNWTLQQPPYAQDNAPEKPWRLQADKAGGGYFFDLAPHGLDILQFLMNDVIADAGGFATNRGGLYSVEDTIAASFVTKNGVVGTAQFSFVTAPNSKVDRLTFVGTAGEIQCAVFAFTPIQLLRNETVETFTAIRPEHIQMPLIQTILDELRGEGFCPSTAETALSTAWAMDKMVEKFKA